MHLLYCDTRNIINGLMYFTLAGNRVEIWINEFSDELTNIQVGSVGMAVNCRHFETA